MKCPVKVAQRRSELNWLLAIYQELKPKRVLEIGSLYGGTLWHWMAHAEPKTVIVSMDFTIYTNPRKLRMIGDGQKQWQGWADQFGVTFQRIKGDSTNVETVQKAEKYAPYDFIFVDGGHYYEIVNADWKNYWPMLNPNGLMAFHDIAWDGTDRKGQQVGKWWNERIKPLPIEKMEMIEVPGSYGIGILVKPNG